MRLKACRAGRTLAADSNLHSRALAADYGPEVARTVIRLGHGLSLNSGDMGFGSSASSTGLATIGGYRA
jgi:hypothetical protein